MEPETLIGSLAALCTTVSYVPQLKKCWQTGSAVDLSLRMLLLLATGVALWLVYGLLKQDAVIMAANGTSLALLLGILYFKQREERRGDTDGRAAQRPADPAALRSSEERYRTVVESARDYAIFTTDHEGRVVDWYDGAATVFGWSAEEIRGRPVDILFVREDRERGEPARELATAAADGEAPDVRWHLRKDGRRVFIDGKVVPVGGDGDQPRGFLKIGQDITARRRAERALKQSEERFTRFADASGDILWIRDAQTMQLEYVSAAFESVYGLEPRAVMGGNDFRRWLRMVHPEDRASVVREIRAVRRGQRTTHEFRICRPDRELRWIKDTDFPLLNEAGAVQSIAGIAADNTDEVIASRRRQVLVNELQHRTRNLIAVVQALAVTTEREAGSLPDFQERFRHRLSALARVQGMLSRLGQGARVTFDQLLEAELTAHGMTADSKRLTLDGPRGVALKSRIVQTFALALHELATNAVKHGALSSPTGHLAVGWRVEDDGRALHVDWRESGVDTGRAAAASVGGSGYGRELIERALPYQMDARTTYAIEPDGVHCTIVLALSGR